MFRNMVLVPWFASRGCPSFGPVPRAGGDSHVIHMHANPLLVQQNFLPNNSLLVHDQTICKRTFGPFGQKGEDQKWVFEDSRDG